MPVTDNTLFGEINREEQAVARLREFEPPDGYYVALSGGKDSTVIYDLCKRSGVKCDYHHSLTTLDAPETIHYIRKEHPDCSIDQPKKAFIKKIREDNVLLPIRQRRWCCTLYKEIGGKGRFVVTGVRSAEGNRRRHRGMVERCYRYKTKKFLHVIIDWTDAEVWEYIKIHNLKVNPLYEEGFKRVGCILCPVSATSDMKRQAERWPKLANAYKKAAFENFKRMSKVKDLMAKTPEEYWYLWLNQQSPESPDQECMVFE